MEIFLTNLQKKILIPRQKIIRIARHVGKDLHLACEELSIVFVGAQRMRRINKEYLGHDYVTDVITFEHGEIIICPQIASQNAKNYRVPLQKELTLYLIHGLLHLAGYDDLSSKDQKKMRSQEQRLMERYV